MRRMYTLQNAVDDIQVNLPQCPLVALAHELDRLLVKVALAVEIDDASLWHAPNEKHAANAPCKVAGLIHQQHGIAGLDPAERKLLVLIPQFELAAARRGYPPGVGRCDSLHLMIHLVCSVCHDTPSF